MRFGSCFRALPAQRSGYPAARGIAAIPRRGGAPGRAIGSEPVRRAPGVRAHPGGRRREPGGAGVPRGTGGSSAGRACPGAEKRGLRGTGHPGESGQRPAGTGCPRGARRERAVARHPCGLAREPGAAGTPKRVGARAGRDGAPRGDTARGRAWRGAPPEGPTRGVQAESPVPRRDPDVEAGRRARRRLRP